MLYVDASVLRLQDMATPKEMVDAELARRGWSKAKLMKLLGYQTGYQDYHSVFVRNPHQLTDELMERIAGLLDKPADWLKDGGEMSSRKREVWIREQFELYLQSDVGQSADPETNRILQSMQWTGKYLPDKRLFQAVALVMEGRYTPAQVLDAVKLEAADRAAEKKSAPAPTAVPRKRSKKSG